MAMARQLREWLDANLTEDVVAAGRSPQMSAESFEVLRSWNRRLADAGWAAVAWPTEHGGRDASVAEQLACLEVMTAAQAPGPLNVIGVANIAPAIMAYGRPEQKEQFLSPMLARRRDLVPGNVRTGCRK